MTTDAASPPTRRPGPVITALILLLAVVAAALVLPRSFPAGAIEVKVEGVTILMCGDGSTSFSRQFEPGQVEATLPRRALHITGSWYGYPRDDSDPPVFVEIYRTVSSSTTGEPVIEFASYCHSRPIAGGGFDLRALWERLVDPFRAA